MRRYFVLAGICSAIALSVLMGAEPVKSGPQVGSELPGPFHPFHINGDNAGEKACLYCRYGGDPVAMIFARRLTPEVATLIKQLEAATVKHKAADLGCCVIFCSDDSGLKASLEKLAKKQELKNVILAIDSAPGPLEYSIAKDAEVTALLYVEHLVKANHSYRKGELNDKTASAIIADLPKILPKK